MGVRTEVLTVLDGPLESVSVQAMAIGLIRKSVRLFEVSQPCNIRLYTSVVLWQITVGAEKLLSDDSVWTPLTRLLTRHAETHRQGHSLLLGIKCSVACFYFQFCLMEECRKSRETTHSSTLEWLDRARGGRPTSNWLKLILFSFPWNTSISSQRCPSYEDFRED